MYRCETKSVQGFIQQLAVAYVARGYYRYVTGWIPEGKDARRVDERIIERYSITRHSTVRSRRKRLGQANLQYIRHDRFFVIIATKGQHDFYKPSPVGESRRSAAGYEERILDIRKRPVIYGGYSLRQVNGHPRVRIARKTYLEEKAYLEDLAARRSVENMVAEFARLDRFEPYVCVRRQLLNIRGAVNKRRRLAGYTEVPVNAIRLRRRIYRPFDSAKHVGSQRKAA